MRNILKTFAMTVIIVSLLFITACDERTTKEKDPGPGHQPPALSNTPDIVVEINFSLLEASELTIDYQGNQVKAITLPDLIDLEEIAELYSYQIVGADGFSPRTASQGGYDLVWDDFATGYLIKTDSTSYRTYYPAFSEVGNNGFNVKNPAIFNLYRSIIVEKIDGESVVFELNILDVVQVDEQDAYRLQDLITPYVSDTPAENEYFFVDHTGDFAREPISWAMMTDGVFIIETGRTFFPNFNEGWNRFRNLQKIYISGPDTDI
ncbi:MAG: hypothetical protein FWG20_04755 [Candidatus Cloacimonetes bacterium]|nr:hypothetical protein [Candidatus Cloacimonadota bacterium]